MIRGSGVAFSESGDGVSPAAGCGCGCGAIERMTQMKASARAVNPIAQPVANAIFLTENKPDFVGLCAFISFFSKSFVNDELGFTCWAADLSSCSSRLIKFLSFMIPPRIQGKSVRAGLATR